MANRVLSILGRRASILIFLASFGCGDSASVRDPISDIPVAQQRTVDRSEFRFNWPFTVGTGTLGCVSDAVVFRAGGVTYALNDAARSRGFTPIDPIQAVQGSGPPSKPLARVKQDQRMEVFAAAVRCDKDGDPSLCRQRLRATRALSTEDLDQIIAEGRERSWPPLSRAKMPLDPLVDAGTKLCERR